MYNMNRDLLVLFNQQLMTPQAMEQEVNKLHELLFQVERTDNVASAYEIIDLNKYKIVRTHHIVKRLIRSRKEEAFIFLNNRN